MRRKEGTGRDGMGMFGMGREENEGEGRRGMEEGSHSMHQCIQVPLLCESYSVNGALNFPLPCPVGITIKL